MWQVFLEFWLEPLGLKSGEKLIPGPTPLFAALECYVVPHFSSFHCALRKKILPGLGYDASLWYAKS